MALDKTITKQMINATTAATFRISATVRFLLIAGMSPRASALWAERAKKMAGMVQKSENHVQHMKHKNVVPIDRMKKWSPVVEWVLILVVV